MSAQSPLKAKPLPNAGDSVDAEIRRWTDDRLLEVLFFAGGFALLASMEWLGYLTHSPRRPILFSCATAIAFAVGAWRVWVIRGKVRQLKLGRDGERVVGQFLERLREGGAQIFHDVPGDGFNLDHVIISPNGLYAIETKTFSKPWPKAKVTVEGKTLLVAGRVPDCDPIEQVASAAKWLESKLEESTGKRFKVRGVVVFPGWFVEQRTPRGPVWVLEPKMLPAFIEQEPSAMAVTDVKLAAFHLSRYIRGEIER
jgi:hypothetical protein